MSVSINSKVATSFDLSSPGNIGGTNPGSGSFTTITTSQDAIINGVTVGSGSGLKNTIVGGGGAGAALLAATGNSVYGWNGGGGASGATGDNNIVISNGADDQLWYKTTLLPYTNSGVWRATDPLFTDFSMLNSEEPFYNVAGGFLALGQNRTGASNVVHGTTAGAAINPPHGVFTSIVDLGGGQLRFMAADTTGLAVNDIIAVYRTANYNALFIISAVNAGVSFDVVSGTFYTSEAGKWSHVWKGFGNVISGDGAAPDLVDGSDNVIFGVQAASGLVHANNCTVLGSFLPCPDADNQFVVGYDGTVTLAFDGAHWHFKKPVKRSAVVYNNASSTLSTNDDVVYLDGTSNNVDVTLPAASTFGAGFTKTFRFRRTDSTGNTVTISPAGADTINGAAAAITILPGWYLDLEIGAAGDGWWVF